MVDASDVVVEVVGCGQRDAAIATEVQPRAREVNVLNVLFQVALAAAYFTTEQALAKKKLQNLTKNSFKKF